MTGGNARRRPSSPFALPLYVAVRWRLRGRWLVCAGLRNETFRNHPIVTTEERGEKVWSFMESEESKK